MRSYEWPQWWCISSYTAATRLVLRLAGAYTLYDTLHMYGCGVSYVSVCVRGWLHLLLHGRWMIENFQMNFRFLALSRRRSTEKPKSVYAREYQH